MEVDKSFEEELNEEISKQIDLQSTIKLAIKNSHARSSSSTSTCDKDNTSNQIMKKDLISLYDSLIVLERNVYALYCFQHIQVNIRVYFKLYHILRVNYFNFFFISCIILLLLNQSNW